MKEATIAFWENGEWKPREDHVFPDYFKIENLPRPRFFPGQKIKFFWYEGYKEGILEKVIIMWQKDYFSYDLKIIFTLGYDVKCIGHSHSLYDVGDRKPFEATLIKE